MNTANIVTLILAILGPFILVLGFDLLQAIVGWLTDDRENTTAGRD